MPREEIQKALVDTFQPKLNLNYYCNSGKEIFNLNFQNYHRIWKSLHLGATLLEDFFLSDVAEIGNSETATSILSVDAMINEVKQRITPDIVQKIQAIYQFDVIEGNDGF